MRDSIQPHRLYSKRGGRQIAAPTGTSVSGTIHPHGLYMQRSLAMNHRRYIAWYHSSTQVIFETWRAANSRPYRRDTGQPHGLYSLRCMAMNHRRYIAWYHSTTRVIFATWRAADCRPYGNVPRFCILRTQNSDRHVENMVIRNKCIVGAATCRPPPWTYNLCG